MIRRVQDQGAGDGDPLPHAAGELVRVLVRVIGDIETDPGDPAAGMLVALSSRHALAFQAERDVVEHGAVVEAGVVLEDHAAVGAGTGHGLAHHEHLAAGRRMLRTQPGDQPQDRALAAAAGAQDADELALVDQVFDDETSRRESR